MKLRNKAMSYLTLAYLSVGTAYATIDVSTGADNVSKAGNSVLNLILIGAAIVGVVFVISGVMGLMQGRNGGGGEASGTHWTKIIGGGVLASIMVIILMITSQVFGTDSEFEKTRTLIESGSTGT